MTCPGCREPFSSGSHAVVVLLAVPATLLLWRLSRGDRLKQISFLIFGACLMFCYAGSALYHGLCLPEEHIERFATLDFIGVYLLIAGTATPLALVVLRGRWRCGVLALFWLTAAVGIGLRLGSVPIPRV